MTDEQILDVIGKLVAEEQALYKRSEEHGGMDDHERRRLDEIKVALDQLWDLLDQRRALRDAGLDPSRAHLRDPAIVERYLQ
jgi:hypothetical protein